MTVLIFIFAALALAATQMLAGGWHPALYLPGYGLLAVAALVSGFRRWRMPVPSLAAEPLVAAAVFFLYIAIRALFSHEEYLARNDLFMALAAMSLYLLAALNLTSSTWRGLFVGCLLLLGIANCILGAIQFTTGRTFVVFDFLTYPDYGSRASGFYGYPNHLAQFLEVCIMMGLSIAVWSRWRPWVKILAGYAALVCLVGLLFTASRGGYIGAFAGLAVFGLLSLRLVGEFARTRAIALLAAGTLLFAALGFGAEHVISRSSLLQTRVDQKVASSDARLQLWKSAWLQFRQQPVVGTGAGTFLYYGRQFSSPTLGSDPVHAHNEYLELLAEYGILGIAAALMFLDAHVRNGWKWISRQIAAQSSAQAIAGNSLALTVGAMSAVAACVVHSGMDFTLHMPANMLTLAYVFGLLANPAGARATVPASADPVDGQLPPMVRLTLPALGLWMVVCALPTLPAEIYCFRVRAITADWQYMASGQVAQEMEDLARRGLRWDPKNPHLYRYAGMAETALASQASDPAGQKKWNQLALDSYGAAARLAPRNILMVLNLAWAYEAEERYAESEPLFKRAIELDPTSADARYAYASHLHAQGRLADAIAQYQKSIAYGGGPSPQAGLDEATTEMKTRSIGAPPPESPR